MKRKFVIVLMLLAMCFGVFAEDSLLLADVPIIYGEESFIQRIEAKTGGEREPIGIVLSGGSARAFAHIGVLQYLEEQGIYPDYIVSNSMGSIIGMLYGAGMSPAQILDVVTSSDLESCSTSQSLSTLDFSMYRSSSPSLVHTLERTLGLRTLPYL